MSGFGTGGMTSMGRGRRGGGFRSDGGGWQQKAQPPTPVRHDDGDDGWDSGGEASTPANGGFQQNAAQTTYQNNTQSNYSQREDNGGRRGRGAGFGRGNNNRSEDGNWRSNSSRDGEDNDAPNRRQGRFGGHRGGDDEQEDGGRRNGFGGESNFRSDRNEGQGEGVTMLEVCSRDVGRIIGKGGMKIRELQDTSGARIKIQSDNDNGLVTPVELKGTAEAQAKAKEMIDELLESFKNVTCFVPLNESKNATPTNRPVIDWAALYRDKDKNAAKKWEEFPEVVKNFYIEDPYVANMHDSEVARIREENNKITVKNLHKDGEGTIPNPVIAFEQAFQHHLLPAAHIP